LIANNSVQQEHFPGSRKRLPVLLGNAFATSPPGFLRNVNFAGADPRSDGEAIPQEPTAR
jgi:hypothetical protein